MQSYGGRVSASVTYQYNTRGRNARRSQAWSWSLRGLLVLMPLAPMTGCADLPPSARQQLIKAYGQYRDQEYSAATATLDVILDEYPRHHESAEGYYLRALCRAARSQKTQATSDALSCVKYSTQKDLTAKAHAMSGSLLFEVGKTSEAIRHYTAALRGLPEKPPTDLVRYRYGLCLQREARWREARLQFAAVFQRYPSSNLAEHARRMYDWPHDHYSVQCGAFREKDGATKLVATLKKAGLRARVESFSRSGELLYMVYTGRYPMYGQAKDALGTVKQHVPDALIVPRGC